MVDLDEFELARTPDEPAIEHRPARAPWLWLVVAALVVATAAAFFLALGRISRPVTTTTGEARPAQPARVRPLGGTAAAIDLPPLDQTDPIVRELTKQISSHPRIAAWLATENLIRTFTVAIENVATGATPAAHLRV